MTIIDAHTHNAAMHKLIEDTRSLLAAPLAGCSAEQLMCHPAGDSARWNAWQIVDHLAASWRATTRGLEERSEKGRPLQTRPTFAQRVGQFAVCRLGYFPAGRKAPRMVQPSEAPPTPLTGDELIRQFSGTLASMDSWLDLMEPAAKGAPVLTHFVLGPLSIDQWRRFHRAHARHHAKQIVNIIRGA